jgi:hypothetical protein
MTQIKHEHFYGAISIFTHLENIKEKIKCRFAKNMCLKIFYIFFYFGGEKRTKKNGKSIKMIYVLHRTWLNCYVLLSLLLETLNCIID